MYYFYHNNSGVLFVLFDLFFVWFIFYVFEEQIRGKVNIKQLGKEEEKIQLVNYKIIIYLV